MPGTEPRVGIAALIRNSDGKIVIGKRKGSHGSSTWAPPGGHLEFGESFADCASREVLEETGLATKNAGVVAATNDIFLEEGKHYVTLYVALDLEDPTAQPEVMEPHKCESWTWMGWDELRRWSSNMDNDAQRKLFLPIQNLLKAYPDIDAHITARTGEFVQDGEKQGYPLFN